MGSTARTYENSCTGLYVHTLVLHTCASVCQFFCHMHFSAFCLLVVFFVCLLFVYLGVQMDGEINNILRKTLE